jgi:hypothetical protein
VFLIAVSRSAVIAASNAHAVLRARCFKAVSRDGPPSARGRYLLVVRLLVSVGTAIGSAFFAYVPTAHTVHALPLHSVHSSH